MQKLLYKLILLTALLVMAIITDFYGNKVFGNILPRFGCFAIVNTGSIDEVHASGSQDMIQYEHPDGTFRIAVPATWNLSTKGEEWVTFSNMPEEIVFYQVKEWPDIIEYGYRSPITGNDKRIDFFTYKEGSSLDRAYFKADELRGLRDGVKRGGLHNRYKELHTYLSHFQFSKRVIKHTDIYDGEREIAYYDCTADLSNEFRKILILVDPADFVETSLGQNILNSLDLYPLTLGPMAVGEKNRKIIFAPKIGYKISIPDEIDYRIEHRGPSGEIKDLALIFPFGPQSPLKWFGEIEADDWLKNQTLPRLSGGCADFENEGLVRSTLLVRETVNKFSIQTFDVEFYESCMNDKEYQKYRSEGATRGPNRRYIIFNTKELGDNKKAAAAIGVTEVDERLVQEVINSFDISDSDTK